MRILPSAFAVLFSGLIVGACSFLDAENDCAINPELACYTGGTGTDGCTLAEECPAGTKCQIAGCTTAGECLLIDKDCKGLDCNAATGLCEGCNNSDKPCPAKECYTITCNSVTETCDEDAQTGDPCINGSCSDGVCLKSDGMDCTSGNECATNNCVDGVCCDGACEGTCQACNVTGSEGTCSPQAVGGTDDPACNTLGGCGETPGYCKCNDGVQNGDETDVDCGGSCIAKCGTGSTCVATNGTDCESAHCVDNRCCNTECIDPCVTCDHADHPGLCLPLPPGQQDQCAGGGMCGSTGLCGNPIADTCATNAQCASNLCTGSPKKCATCANDNDCGAVQKCVDGNCFNSTPGAPCETGEGCMSGHCVDGVCCDTPCTGLCMGCQNNYTGGINGACAPILGPAAGYFGYDPHDECNGPGASGACSGAMPDANNASSCGEP